MVAAAILNYVFRPQLGCSGIFSHTIFAQTADADLETDIASNSPRWRRWPFLFFPQNAETQPPVEN